MDISSLRTVINDQLRTILLHRDGELSRINEELGRSLSSSEITVVTGVRRCGKSTLVQQLIRNTHTSWNIHYINFEDQRLHAFEFKDFEAAYNDFLLRADSGKRFLLIYDEIQNIEGWERWVSSFASSVGALNSETKVIITGSNARLLSTELSTLLTGRHERIELTPLSLREVVPLDLHPIKDEQTLTSQHALELKRVYLAYSNYGGFPKAYTSKSTQILSQYFEDITVKDIAVRKRVRNISALQSLGMVLASQNTRLFNKSRVATELGIKDTTTLNKFCSYFIETYLFSEIRCFSRTKRQQLRSLSKFYCVDPIMAREVGYHSSESNYWILENFVFSELKKRYREIWYWRSEGGYEVDFIAKDKTGELHAYQVALSIQDDTTRSRELRALNAAKEEIGVSKSFIITEYEQEEPNSDNLMVDVVPFYLWAVREKLPR